MHMVHISCALKTVSTVVFPISVHKGKMHVPTAKIGEFLPLLGIIWLNYTKE